jgi:hypothetical protein
MKQMNYYLRAGFLRSEKSVNQKRGRKIISERKRIQVKKEFQELLKRAQELTKAKFVKVNKEWWDNLRSEMNSVGQRVKQATDEFELAKRRLEEFHEGLRDAFLRTDSEGMRKLSMSLEMDLKREVERASRKRKEAITFETPERVRKLKQDVIERTQEQWTLIKKEQEREFLQAGLLGENLSQDQELAIPAQSTQEVHVSRKQAIQEAREYQIQLLREKLGGVDQGIHRISTPQGRSPERPRTDVPSDAAISRQRTCSQLESQQKAQGIIGGGGITVPLQKLQIKVQQPPYQCQVFQVSLSHDSPAICSKTPVASFTDTSVPEKCSQQGEACWWKERNLPRRRGVIFWVIRPERGGSGEEGEDSAKVAILAGDEGTCMVHRLLRRVRSWRHTSGGRLMVQRGTCVANGHPPPNLSRNLFLCGGFLSSTESACSMAQRDNRHSGGPTALPRLGGPTGRCPVQS